MSVDYAVYLLKQEGIEFHMFWTLGEWMDTFPTEKEAEEYIASILPNLNRIYTIVKIYSKE